MIAQLIAPMRAHNMKFTHAVLLMVLVGCGSTAGIARRQFATAYRCPEDRVIVTPAPSKTSLPQDPPPEVTRASLRMGIVERLRKMSGMPTLLFDIHGCGHHDVYACVEQEGLDPSNGDPVTLVSCFSDSDASRSNSFNTAASLLGPMLATATISIPRLGLVTTGRPGDGLAVVSVSRRPGRRHAAGGRRHRRDRRRRGWGRTGVAEGPDPGHGQG